MPSQTTEFEHLLEAVPDALLGVDEAGVIRLANRQGESLFGYERDDLIGMPVEHLVPESLRLVHHGHRQEYNAAPRTRPMGTNLKLIGVRHDGTAFPADISLSARQDVDGLLVIAAVRDMTARNRAERDRQLMSQQVAVVQFSGEAISSGTLDGIIRSWNPAAERLFGYASDEIVGTSGQVIIPKDRADERHTILDRIRSGEVVEDFETVRVREDGTTFAASLTVSPIRDGDDTVIGASAIIRDVTEQKHAFEAAQRMAAIVEYSDDAITASTLDGIVTSWNPAAEWLYGCSAKEIIGQSGSLVVPGDRADELNDILSKIRAGEHVRHLETIRLRQDRTVFPVSLTVSPIRDPDGTIVGAVWIARDVTEQREAQADAQRMAALVDYSDDAIISKTLDGTITSWNPAAERLYGYTNDEIIGKSIELLVPQDKASELQDIVARIKAGEHVENIETTRLRKGGTVFQASLTISPILGSGGTIIGASSIAHDVTHQREASELARSMIESSLDPMVTISPDGKITDVNEATVRAIGLARDQLIGTSFSAYFTEPEKAEEIYQRVFTEGMAMDYPLTLRHRDGDQKLTEVLYNASIHRDPSGRVLGVFATARDVTEHVEAAQYARSLIEAALDPMVTISPEGDITDVNEATVKATGVPREMLIGTSFSGYFTDPAKAEEIYQRVITQGKAVDYPLTLRHRNEHETLVEVLYNASAYRDAAGRVRGVFAAARDMTQQIQAQKEIAERQARELDRLAELERFQRLTVGRELKMIDLKKEIEYLKKYGPDHGGESEHK
jgi:PAS domain S-box-containing protein